MKINKPRCKAFTKSGKPCGAAPTDTGLCFLHGNPAKASQLGRIGGLRNRGPHAENIHLVPKLEGAASAAAEIEFLYRAVQSGSIKPAVANVLIKLTDLRLRVQEKTAMQDQASRLEAQVRDLKSLINTKQIETSTSEFGGNEVEGDEIEDDEAEGDEGEVDQDEVEGDEGEGDEV
jgi:hypothetical protein